MFTPVVTLDVDDEPSSLMFADPDSVTGQVGRAGERVGFCAVARFEHLGGPLAQRIAAIVTVFLPLVVLVILRRLDRHARARR